MFYGPVSVNSCFEVLSVVLRRRRTQDVVRDMLGWGKLCRRDGPCMAFLPFSPSDTQLRRTSTQIDSTPQTD